MYTVNTSKRQPPDQRVKNKLRPPINKWQEIAPQPKTAQVDFGLLSLFCFGYCLCDTFPVSILYSIRFDESKLSSEMFVHEEFELSNDYLGIVFKKGLSF
jgi:hypothetical protein